MTGFRHLVIRKRGALQLSDSVRRPSKMPIWRNGGGISTKLGKRTLTLTAQEEVKNM